LASKELLRVKNDFGNSAIYAGSYGWASAGRFHHAKSQLNRFLIYLEDLVHLNKVILMLQHKHFYHILLAVIYMKH
jgi:hypothetical protein